jgi:hypothetical protein
MQCVDHLQFVAVITENLPLDKFHANKTVLYEERDKGEEGVYYIGIGFEVFTAVTMKCVIF